MDTTTQDPISTMQGQDAAIAAGGQGGGAQPGAPYVPPGLDPKAYILTKALAYQEGGGSVLAPDAPGKSGEVGIYQYEPSTWDARAKQFLGSDAPSIQDATPDQQNEVTYKWVQSKLAAGYSPAQVASMHNAGEGAPDAWQGNQGTNAEGVQYNTKQYVQNVQKYAEQLWNGQDPSTGQKTGYGYVAPPKLTPVAEAAAAGLPGGGTPTPGANDPTLGDQVGASGLLKTGVDFVGSLLPFIPDVINDIQGKSDKSALQQLGDAGMTAMWFLPFGGIAEGAGLGLKALGVGADVAKTAGIIGTGAATGYLGSAAANLGAGQSVPQAFAPNSSTLTGAALGGGISAAALGAGALYNKFAGQQTAVDDIAQAYNDAAGATKSGVKGMSKTAAAGLQPSAEFLANAGIMPETEEINGRRVFTTGQDSASQQAIQQRIGALADLRDAALEKGPVQDLGGGTTVHYNPPTVNLEDLRSNMLDQAGKDFSGTARETAEAQINREMDALAKDPKYAIDANGDMSATQASKIKTYLQGRANLDRATQGLSAQVFDTMQGVAKKSVEDAAEASGNPNVRAINKIIQQHYDALKFLDRINGQTIKGGRLGTYVKEGIGAAVGGAAGTVFGGGPVGTGVGTLAGAAGGKLVSDWMQRFSVGGPMTAATIGRMATEEPEEVQNLLQYLGTDAKGAIAPILKPEQANAAARVMGFLKKTPGQYVFRGMSRKGYAFGGRP